MPIPFALDPEALVKCPKCKSRGEIISRGDSDDSSEEGSDTSDGSYYTSSIDYDDYSSSGTSSGPSGGLIPVLALIGIVIAIFAFGMDHPRQDAPADIVQQASIAPEQQPQAQGPIVRPFVGTGLIGMPNQEQHVDPAAAAPPSSENGSSDAPTQNQASTQNQTSPAQSLPSLPTPSSGPWRRTDCETRDGTYQCRWCPDPNYSSPIVAGCYFRPSDGDMNAEAASGAAPSDTPPAQSQESALPSVTPGPWTRSDCEMVDGTYQCRWCPNPAYTNSFARPCYMRPAQEDMNITIGDNVPQ